MSRPIDLTPLDAYRELYYGVPVETIADWLDCSLSQAKALKAGKTRPSASSLKLFKLHLEGRVLTDEWAGWGVRRGVLCDPEGHETTQPQLRAYPFVWQLAHEYGRQNQAAQAELSRIISRVLHRPESGNPQQRQRLRMPDQAAEPSETTDAIAQNRKSSVGGGGADAASRHQPQPRQTPRAAQPPRAEGPSDREMEAYNQWLGDMGFLRAKSA